MSLDINHGWLQDDDWSTWPTAAIANPPLHHIHLPLPDNARCMYCGEVATTWDHVRPLAWGGADDPVNMVPACWPCNQQKGDMPVDLFRLTVTQRRDWLRGEGWIPRVELPRDPADRHYAMFVGRRFWVPLSGNLWWDTVTGLGCSWPLAIRKATWGPETQRTGSIRRYWW